VSVLRLSVMQFAGARVPPSPCRAVRRMPGAFLAAEGQVIWPAVWCGGPGEGGAVDFFPCLLGEITIISSNRGWGVARPGPAAACGPALVPMKYMLINSEGAEGRHAHRGKGPPARARRKRPPAANAQVRLSLPAADEKGCRNWLGGRPAGPRCCPDRCFTPIADTSRTPNTCLDKAHGRRRERIVARRLARLDMTRTGLHTCVCGVRAFVRACVRPG